MRKVGFIGACDKTDLIMYTAKALQYMDKKVLVVDDNMLNIKVATRLLKNYKIIPDTVLSGEEALKKIKAKQQKKKERETKDLPKETTLKTVRHQ